MSGFEDLEPVLEASEIQGNILGGFNKDHQTLIPLFFGEEDVASVRRWLKGQLDRITWLPEVVTFKRRLRQNRAASQGEPPEMLNALWTTIAFSYPGLRKLTPEADGFEPVFRDGLPSAVGRIGDPLAPGVPGHVDGWVIGGPGNVPDILVIIAGDEAEAVHRACEAFVAEAEAAGLRTGPIDVGHDLSHYDGLPAGREHFGFKDGVSQPGVRGRMSADVGDFVTPRRRAGADLPSQPEFSAPGQPLVCVGEFVLGYPRQSDSFGRQPRPGWRLGPQPYIPDPQAVGPWWARNGSFLVYRRLYQDVPAFNRFLEQEAARLAATPGWAGLTGERLGAMLVGRWRSGAPLLRTPAADDPALGGTEGANNAFAYSSGSQPEDEFPGAAADALGRVCPQAAHIRKVNPRDLNTDQGPANATLTRRLLRRGIPYGPPLPFGATGESERTDRGLLFLSYQSSIVHQFEFLVASWTNSPTKPTPQFTAPPGAGIDLIMGQNPEADRRRWCQVGPDRMRVDASGPDWVVATGGGYFFAPSRQAIDKVLCTDPG